MARHIHVINKAFGGSGLSVVKELSDGANVLSVELSNSWTEIMGKTSPGDCLIFHSRYSLTNALPFLLYNRVKRRNTIAYNPHTNLRTLFPIPAVLGALVDKVVCLTEFNKRELERSGMSNVVVIPNPVPYKRLAEFKARPSAEKTYDFAWAGRNVDFKRIDIFIDVFAQMKDAKCLILTNRLSPEQERKLAAAPHIKTILGSGDEQFFRELSRSRAYVFTSNNQEGLPVLMLEVIYLGIPVIATDTPKYREILKGKGTYWKDEADLRSICQAVLAGRLKLEPIPEEVVHSYDPSQISKLYDSL